MILFATPRKGNVYRAEQYALLASFQLGRTSSQDRKVEQHADKTTRTGTAVVNLKPRRASVLISFSTPKPCCDLIDGDRGKKPRLVQYNNRQPLRRAGRQEGHTNGVTGRQQLEGGLVSQERMLQLVSVIAGAASWLGHNAGGCRGRRGCSWPV